MSNFNKTYDRTSTGKKRYYRKTQYRFYWRNPSWGPLGKRKISYVKPVF